MPLHKSNILIILPAYNELSVIESVILDIKKSGYKNICVIDDGSTDDTGKVAKKAGAIVLTHPVNRGAGASVQTGLLFAKKNNYKIAITMDSDGQHYIEDVEKLLYKMTVESADIVVGNRFGNKLNDIPIRRIAYNKMANALTNVFCKNNYSDTQSGLRLFNRNAIENLKLKNRGFGFCSEMLIAAEHCSLNVVETPIKVKYTDYSMSKGQNLSMGLRTARNILWRVIFQ